MFLLSSAFGQGTGRRMPAASDQGDQDQPQQRGTWNMRGREAPKGESAAALRLRAYQQKLAMRAFRAAQLRAAGKQPQGPQTTSWVGLGPAPLASDATGNGGQDYNWVSGRATSVLVDPADTTGNTVLLGGAYGGLWRSTNAGNQNSNPALVTWQSLIDDQPSLAVGAIAVQPGSGSGGVSQVILVGTGETNASGDSYYGMGILRSTDGGNTWTQITQAASGQSFVGVGFSKIAFSTANTSLVVASTAGDIGFDYGLEQDANSTARGIYYSTDAGATWNRVTLADGAVPASVTGVVYNATAGAFFAAIRRHGIYTSTDGQHFTRLTTQPTSGLSSANCPANSNSSNCQIYRAEFAVTPGRNEMYTWIVDIQGGEVDDGVWKTTNGGSSWTQISNNGITNCGSGGGGETGGTDAGSGCGATQGVYNLELAAVPSANGTDTDLYAGAVNLFKCHVAGGASACSTIDPGIPNDWINLTHVYGCNPLGENAHVHPDQHGLAFMVVSGKAQGYFAHDGGISRTQDGFTGLDSGTCTTSNQFDSLSQTLGSMTEFVSFSVHPTSADIMLGGTQDNGSPKTATGTSSTTWQNALGGDGGFNAINPNPAPSGAGGDGIAGDEWFVSNPNSVIGVCEAGTACDDNNAFLEAIPGYPNNGNIDQGPFYTNYILDPQSTGEMLIGTCRIWRGDTVSATFSQISQNFDTGGTGLCNGGEVNQVADLAAGGPKDANGFSNVVYATTWGYGPFAGLGGGEVWSTTNAVAGSMNNVTGSINPNHYAITAVAMDTSVANGQTAYVGITGFHVKHVFKTTNAGGAWTDWTGSGNTALPDAPVSALLVDSNAGVVYAGTDVGVFSSPTSGSGGVWTEVGPVAGPGVTGFLPSAPVTAIQIFNPSQSTKKLRVSTYGRGIWEFNLNAQPDFTNVISNSPQTAFPSTNAVFNGTLTAQNGYNNNVTLSCTGTPPSTCTPNPTQLIPASTGSAYTITAAGAVGDYSFNAHATDGTLSHDAAITLHVVDFAVGAPNPGTVDVPIGFTGTTTFQVTAQGSFAQSVTLSCSSGLPTGASCSFAPSAIVNPTSSNPVTVTLTVSAAGNTPQGTTTVTIQGATSNPAGTRTTTFQLVVQPAPDFTWTGSGSHTVLAGQSTPNYTFTATPTSQSTFLGNVTFSCSFSPTDPTLGNSSCNFTPASIAAGAGATNVTLSIKSTGPNQGTGTRPQLGRQAYNGSRSPLWPLALPMAGILFAGFAGRKVSRYSALTGLFVSLCLLGMLIACGSSSTPPPPPAVSVSVSPSAAANLYANEAGNSWPAPQTQQYTATVSNSSNTAVTWTLSQGSTDCTTNPACGSLSATTGSPVTYTAPATVPNPAAVTVKATSQADTTKSGSGSVNVLQPTAVGPFTVTVTATEGSVSHQQQVTMTVQ